jgi:hypothetical protein
MTWVIVNDGDDVTVYGRIDDDGLMRVTAIEGYAGLDEWLAEANPDALKKVGGS